MRFFLICASVFSLSALCAEESEEVAAKRVYAHLLIRDSLSAVKEAQAFVAKYPLSKPLKFALIRALSEKGDETEAWEQWRAFTGLFPEECRDRRLLEVIAWGVLGKGENSSQPAISINSLLGAAFTHDAKAIPLLLNQLRSSNATLRSIAIRLSTTYGDSPLKDEILRMLKSEKVWYVRLELIQAVGHLRMLSARPLLKEIIAHPKTMAEEKAAAIIAMVGMYDALSLGELKNLTSSNRAGLRQLACDLVAHLDYHLGLQEIVPLLQDTSPEVRMSALNALGLMRVSGVGGIDTLSLIEGNLKDSSPQVQITAAWVALLQGSPRGEGVLEKWILSQEESFRRLASGAVSVSGQYGLKLSERMLKRSPDLYVRANLALGMIGQRKHVGSACDTLYEVFFKERKTLWMWDNQINPLFKSLAPSRERHIDHIPHYPLVIDQMVRLDLLSTLSIMRYPKAQEAVRGFLQHQSWGVSATAASTLIQEGDEESFRIVRNLLEDPDEKIRLQAALILAMLGGDPAAIKVLQETYPHVDREMKVSILEALARIGDPETIPFLTEILKEPFQVLRVVAASALIQCLYH